jgi:D-cysteine desulfhydrase
MHLARFSRRRYTHGPTPLEPLPRLSRYLGGPDIWIKRDDLTGLAGGGNKTRKLEFIVADALEQRCDTLITVGAAQSNHCRLTLGAAVKESLMCRLVLEQSAPDTYIPSTGGNNFLFNLLGVECVTVVERGSDLDSTMRQVADELSSVGRKGYIIPAGGSTPLGSLGYVACAEEILAQTFNIGLPLDCIVCASGSAGTHAGILVGLLGNHANIKLIGIAVRRPRGEQESIVHKLAQQIAGLLNVPPVPGGSVRALDEWRGPGYSLLSDELVAAVRLVARLEGVLLDPVYTGKAMAGLIGLIRRGDLKRGETVLFVHTGGSPTLYAYQSVLQSWSASCGALI